MVKIISHHGILYLAERKLETEDENEIESNFGSEMILISAISKQMDSYDRLRL